MSRIGVAVCATAALWLSFPALPAAACSCAATSATAHMASADVVFRGAVISSIGGDSDVSATLRVLRVYKGSPEPTVEIRTPAHSSACGVEFVPDAEYVVFAGRSGSVLATSLCSGTTDDLATLDRLGIAAREPAVPVSAPRDAPGVARPGGRAGTVVLAAVACAAMIGVHASRFRRARSRTRQFGAST